MASWVVYERVQGSDEEHSYPVVTFWGPFPDEASADTLREQREAAPLQENRERSVTAWQMTEPGGTP